MTAPSSIAARTFRTLHGAGCFVLPNAWDVGSAVYLSRRGFKAVATTSAGFAFTRALPDSPTALSVDAVLEHCRELAAAVPIPVNADFQSAYADAPEAVARNVVRCVETGVGGLSVEDATGNPASPLYERGLAVERIRAARAAIDASGAPVVLTARCEAWLVGAADPMKTALYRLVAFADAGADCLFAPGVRDPDTIRALVQAVAPKPLNVLVSAPAPGLTLARFEDLGVRRISVGSALARVAWGAVMRATQQLEQGSFEGLAGAAPFAELEALFGGDPG
jgi:2-methylisocitrate lyase-like PEP mutase family enzyme